MAATSLGSLSVAYNHHHPEKQQHLTGGQSTSGDLPYTHTHTYSYYNYDVCDYIALKSPYLDLVLLSYSADDVASDFTLRGLSVQSIHGDR